MKRIKLDAIDSTNEFLKAMAARPESENFTVVTAESQTKGKGQRGSSWNSECGKNLIVSVLIKNVLNDVSRVFDLNIAVALSIIDALKEFSIPDLAVKWPNDILSGSKKLGGILIENSIKSDGKIVSVVGIGLNINQIQFENLPKASSLALVTGQFFEKEEVLSKILCHLKNMIADFGDESFQNIWNTYHNHLFKKGIPVPFEDLLGNRFMGIIEKVDKNGKLVVLMGDNSYKIFDIKEIQMLY